MDKTELGLKVKRIRSSKGWTQKELERISGVSERSIQEIEAGRANPTLSQLEDLGQALKEPLVSIGANPKLPPAAGGIKEAIQILSHLESLSPVKQAVVLSLIFADERYINALRPSRPVAQAFRTLSKGLEPPEG